MVYCDRDCMHEYLRNEALKKRENIYCTHCKKRIDYPVARKLSEREHVFCDYICFNAYTTMRETWKNGIQQAHNKTNKGYKKPGVATANHAAPTKLKITREGKIFGHTVLYIPLEDNSGYWAILPDIPDFPMVNGKYIRDVRKQVLRILRESTLVD